jgi:hypothetical protein
MTRPSRDDPGPFASLVAEMEVILGTDLPAAHHLGAPEIAGQLEQTDVALLIGGAFNRGFSGSLTLIDASGSRGLIWFDAGRPIDVVLGDASPGARAEATCADVERWFLAIVTWTSGRFIFAPLDPGVQPHRTHALRHPVALIHESLQRRGTGPLRAWLGQDTNRLTLRRDVGADALVEAAVAEPALATALRLFDGSRSFRDIARGARLDEDMLLRALFALFGFGAVDFASDADLQPQGSGRAHSATADQRARLGALRALAESSDYFAFLGVDRTASRAEILTAVACMGREIRDRDLHPDVALATGRERAVITDVLSEAARILGDDGLRARYREALGIERVEPEASAGKFAPSRPGP